MLEVASFSPSTNASNDVIRWQSALNLGGSGAMGISPSDAASGEIPA